MTEALNQLNAWFEAKSWQAQKFQKETWKAYLSGKNGILTAATGSGKTYAIGGAILAEYLMNQECSEHQNGIQVVWISPIRALAKEIEASLKTACAELDIPWEVGRRTGDTTAAERAKQKKQMPQILITTPESLQLLLASKGYQKQFRTLKCMVNDEWHELLGSKRAVQMELAQSRLKSICPALKIWGISATIGNLEEGLEVLLGSSFHANSSCLIQANVPKRIDVRTIIPKKIEEFPWSGHLGIHLLEQIVPLIKKSKSSLVFTNTRAQAEIWYQKLLEAAPELAGQIAMHHGSISRELRDWVEEALHEKKLKAVVCTSSLDLGVDFRPVDQIIQIGSPKGIARFMQRAGRSGHQPGAKSKIHFVPTHSLEIIEGAALASSIDRGQVEARIPFVRSFDVLIQYLVSLAVSDGFDPVQIFHEVKSTFCFSSMSKEEWAWVLHFIVEGGQSLNTYNEFKKVEIDAQGIFRVKDRGIAMRHRLSIGTIVSEPAIRICFLSGKFIGTIEEYFVSRLKPGDVFWFAGRNLELIQLKGVQAFVKRSNKKNGKVPSWQGGRMPLSSQLSEILRIKIMESYASPEGQVELEAIAPLIQRQAQASCVPTENEFLIETLETKEGYHAFFYPFEGRFVHEGMASVIAYRISLIQPISFSIALNDYGFELLSDREIPIQEAIDNGIFTAEHLREDIQAAVNSTEMARRKFRDIASISGLVFRGFPGKNKKDKHLQASSQLFFDVFQDYENQNLLFLQAFEEVMDFQLEESRMRTAFQRMENQIIQVHPLEKASPFCFPILVDRLREKLSSEKLEDRIKRMKKELGAS